MWVMDLWLLFATLESRLGDDRLRSEARRFEGERLDLNCERGNSGGDIRGAIVKLDGTRFAGDRSEKERRSK